MLKLWLSLLLSIAGVQNTCAALVPAAYSAVALECPALEPGEACFGNAPLQIAALDRGRFSRPGDQLSGIVSLESGALEAGEWGVALLSIPVNHPDQLLTMIVLGGVTLENASPNEQPVNRLMAQITFAGGTHLRAEPDEAADSITPLVTRQTLMATGRLEDGSWFRLRLADGRSGWVRADLITLDGDFTLLPVVSADDDPPESLFSPLQALTLRTAESAPPCREAPPNGLLIQTTQPVDLLINGVLVNFDGTVFIEANDTLTVNVLESTAQITLNAQTENAFAGQRLRLRFDEESNPILLLEPELYPYVEMQAMPWALLPREIEFIPVNLRLATPAVRGQEVLAGVNASSACTIGAVNEVRLRSGPGRDYPIQISLSAGDKATVDARAEGTDGMLWWRLSPALWVRSDVVLVAGTCGELPLIDRPPLPEAEESS